MTVGLLALLTLSTAQAADVDPYRPATSAAAGQGTLQGESPVLGPEGLSGGIAAGFAQDPVVRRIDGAPDGDAVSALLPVSLHGGWTLDDTARFDLVIPVYAHVQAPITGYSGAALGDLRLQATVPLAAGRRVAFGFVPRLELPTGTADALTRSGLGGGGSFAFAGTSRDELLGWVANAGVTGALADRVEGVALGSTVDAVLGAWWQPDSSFRGGAEVDLRAGLARGPDGGSTTSALHLFAQQVLASGIALQVGAGAGLVGGVGTPDYRVVAGLHFGAGLPDSDGDGRIGAADQCPDLPEDPDGFEDEDGCPDPDNDGDDLADIDDRCPSEAEDRDGFEDHDGCPDTDNDGDGVADAQDPCPDTPGPDTGCPDGDGDGVADDRDACPAEAGPADERPHLADGCPKPVWLAADQIRTGVPLRFVDRTAELAPESQLVLDGVLGLLLSQPQLELVQIQAHVDDGGSVGADFGLSKRRAKAVLDWLIAQGVERARLDTRAFGHDQPVDTNRTATGRERNQRVEFAILEQGEAAATAPDKADGSLTVVVSGGVQAEVIIDGVPIQRAAPFADLPIPAGTHEIRVRNLDAGLDDLRTITVDPGESERVVVVPLGVEPSSVIDVEQREGRKKRPKR